MNRRKAAAVAGYAATALLALAAAVWLLDLRAADLRVPFDYRGDTLLYALTTKAIVDHGWYLHNPLLGAPFGLDLHDYPFSDGFHHLVMRAMAIFTSDWAVVFNVYYLLGFPLIALAAVAVFRHFRIGWGPAVVASLLYAFTPSRLLKGESHIFMGMFFEVPLAVLVILWVASDRPPFWRQDGPGIEMRSGRSIAAILIALLTAFTGLYYAFFTCCLLLVAGLWGSVVRRSWGNGLAALALAGIIVAGLGASGLPTLRYRATHGPNPEVAARGPAEAEIHGLRIAHLLLPVTGHRIEALRRFKDRYDATAPLMGENAVTSLGVVGSVGFVALLWLLLLGPRRERTRDDLWRMLAVLNVSALLLATMGGGSALVAWLVTPQIRTYARMNVVVEFLALFAVVLLLERLLRRRPRLGIVLLPVVLVLGLLDQATPRALRDYAGTARAYANDGTLVQGIEAAVPRGGMIFQLPYLPFPEASGRSPEVADYDPLRLYLHSATLRWSYPTMRARAGDVWVREVSQMEPATLVRTISDVGFEGVVIDRLGYRDRGKGIEAALGQLLGVAPLVGPDGRHAFFSLGRYNEKAHAGIAPAALALQRDRALHPLLFRWDGFFGVERDAQSTFRWCGGSCELRVRNEGTVDREVSLRMTLVAAQPPAHLTIDGDLLSETVELGPAGAPFSRTVKVSPGAHVIRMRSDSRPADAPLDPRLLVWRALDFSVAEKP